MGIYGAHVSKSNINYIYIFEFYINEWIKSSNLSANQQKYWPSSTNRYIYINEIAYKNKILDES